MTRFHRRFSADILFLGAISVVTVYVTVIPIGIMIIPLGALIELSQKDGKFFLLRFIERGKNL